MSGVLWCDKGQHPFSVLETGWQQMSMKESYEDAQGNMQSRAKQLDVCAAHSVIPTLAPAVEAAPDDTHR